MQFITFRLWDSMPASRKGEWEHLLAITERSYAPRSAALTGARSIASPEPAKAAAQRIASREQRIKLEEHLDRGLGEGFLCGSRFDLLAWVVMPNHVHALIEVGDTPLSKSIQNWKSIVAVKANQVLGRTGDFWQLDYWDTFMRDEAQTRKAIRYIENNPVKARLCCAPEDWPFSSARFRDPQTRELKLP